LYEVFCEERGPSLTAVDEAAAGAGGVNLTKQVVGGVGGANSDVSGGGGGVAAAVPTPLTPLEKAEYYSTAQSLPGVASGSSVHPTAAAAAAGGGDGENAGGNGDDGGSAGSDGKEARFGQWKDMSALLTEAVKLMFSKADEMLGGATASRGAD
jgi:hypothetical protein